VSHDIDDGLRADLIALTALADQPLAGAAIAQAPRGTGVDHDGRRVYEITRRMITVMIADVVGETRGRLASLQPLSPDDIRRAPRAMVAFSAALAEDIASLKGFLLQRVYRHAHVMRVMTGAERIVRELFSRYLAGASAMPEAWHAAASGLDERHRARLIADFVAGMTDRYAIAEHRRLFDATPDLLGALFPNAQASAGPHERVHAR
jgi:dGTPase